MQCGHCGVDNPVGTKFCGECGTSLPRRCTQCGVVNPPQFKFCGECGSSQRAPILWGLWGFHLIRGELGMAQMLAEESLQIAEQTNEAEILLQARNFVGETWLCRGEFIRARAVLEQNVASYQPQYHALTPFGGINPQVVSLDYTALVLGYLGYVEQARMQSHEALQLARELGHPYSFVFALTFASMLHLECGEGRVVREYTDTLVALSSEHGFPFYLAWGTLLRGAALRLVEKNDERFYEAEVWRIAGELTLRIAHSPIRPFTHSSPEECFLKAIAIAQKQHAKSLELRAVMSLVRLRQNQAMEHRAWSTEPGAKSKELAVSSKEQEAQSRVAEAHTLLSEVYNWFTEGFDTKDL